MGYAKIVTEDFESEWEQIADEYGLREKQCSCQMHDKKEMWASAYLRDKFCAGYRTTSRCEGINAYVNKFSKSTHTIYELVQSLKMVALYTREVFGDVKKEIEGVGALNLINKRRIMNTMVYSLEEYEEPDVHIMASFGWSTRNVSCQCNFWKKHGYPCKHMFFVMKAEHLKEILDKLVLMRWRTDAKSPEQYTENWGDVSEHGVILRHGALHFASQWMFFLGAQRLALFQKAMRGIQSLCKDLELDYKAFHGGVRPSAEHAGEGNPVVRDPVVARSKGAPKLGKKKSLGKRRCCTCCKRTGHTKRKCPTKGEHDAQHELGDDAFEGGRFRHA
ncbi:protein FAR-RED ELONGATED HYPOCOTYL 3-like [Arachis ipaensis]|nr:protein FAR-RED ELONGATED HYPOCOTYL 3-like [Arachis ipaensis]